MRGLPRQRPSICADAAATAAAIGAGTAPCGPEACVRDVPDGAAMHRRVPKDRWCVNRADLIDFERRVRSAIQLGHIQPTARDDFDPCDRCVGPNIYSVNEQFIKPVTKAAGMMSWALMLHADGLKCDLFITHAWQEGIFEFIHKVLHSWPRGTFHAYCCMLANPQNLDIGSLISSPRESPFALALLSANHMLVVPNHKVSIYTRLWCAFEAFLAYESDKVIQIASAPTATRPLLSACLWVCGAALGGALAGWLRHRIRLAGPYYTETENVVYWPAVNLPWLGAAILDNPTARRACHLCGATVNAFYLSTADMLRPDQGDKLSYSVASAIGVCFYIISEVDRVRNTAAGFESELLRNGFASIRSASCSVQSDADYIRSDIGPKVGDVDQAIQILMRAGMWNRGLRTAAEAGVDIKDAAHVELALPLTTWAVQLLVMLILLAQSDWPCRLFALVILALQVSWFIAIAYLPADRRVFGIKSMAKLSPCWGLAACLTHLVFHYALGIKMEAPLLRGQAALLIGFTTFALALLVAGVDNVARWPGCGRAVAQLMVARNWCRCRDSSKEVALKFSSDSEADSGLKDVEP